MRQSELIGLVTVALLGFGSLAVGRHAASGLEEAALEDGGARLAAVGFTELELAADGLILEVSGRVRSAREREIARAAVGETGDVAAVVDNIVVVEPLVDLRPAVLRIQKDDTGLTLTGEAPNAEARDLLASRAGLAVAGGEFLNLMKAQDRRASEIWLETAEAAIDAVAALRVGQAAVERDVLRLEGAAADAADRDRIVDALNRQLADRVALEIDVTSPPPLVSPYEFVASWAGGAIDLRLCHAPDAATRAEIMGDLRSLAGEAGVEGRCQIATGAPNTDWTRAAQRAIAALGALREGEVRLRDDRAWVTGFLDKGANIEAASAQASRGWPALYSVAVDVREILPIVRPFSMTIVKRPGDVRLAGVATSPARAERWAEKLDATNALELARGAPAGFSDAADVIVAAIAELKIGSASLTDRAILLEAPGASSDRARLSDRLRAQLPEGFRLDVVEARAPAAAALEGGALDRGVYRFTAARADGGTVSLGGLVEDPTARSVLTAYARAQLGGDAMEGSLALGDGPSPVGWQRALFAGLEALAELDEGELTAEEGAIYLRGLVAEAGQARLAMAALEAKAPPDYTRFSRITVAERSGDDDGFGDAPAALPPEACVARLNGATEASPILFGSGSADLGADNGGTLDALSSLLRRCPDVAVEIGGHTDSQGAEQANLALSKQRAASVLDALTARGVAPDRLSSDGYGESKPIAENDTAEGRARNRRIEFTIVK